MKLKPICDCDENKVITGQMDGEMIWREKTKQEKELCSFPHIARIQKRLGVDIDTAYEVYEANSN